MPKQAFPPLADSNSKILILGTMPGEQSLKLQQYYGHRGNQFWKIIYRLFEKPLSINYEERKKLLQEKGIALWDVLDACERDGSSDNQIMNEKPNDFDSFYKKHPSIRSVFFASGKARDYYDMHIKRKPGITYNLLPSPSGANTWKTFDEKVQEWAAILGYL